METLTSQGLAAANVRTIAGSAPKKCLLKCKTGPEGRIAGALRLRKQCPRKSMPRGSRVTVRAAQQQQHHDAVISGVDELADGSVVLHFSEDTDRPPHEKQIKEVVSFLTRPVKGHQRRSVSEDTLDELVGDKRDHSPVRGVASFVKGVISLPPSNGATAAAAPAVSPAAAPPATLGTNGAAAAAAAAAAVTAPNRAPVESQATVSPAHATLLKADQHTVAPTAAQAEPVQSGFDAARALVVAVASAIVAVGSRLAAMHFQYDNGVALLAPVSVAAVVGLFFCSFVFLWSTGFPQKAGNQTQGITA